jgi:hypothetical protein
MSPRPFHVLPPRRQEGLRREIAGLQREIEAHVRARELARQHGASARELDQRRAKIARLRWRLATAASESTVEEGPEAA